MIIIPNPVLSPNPSVVELSNRGVRGVSYLRSSCYYLHISCGKTCCYQATYRLYLGAEFVPCDAGFRIVLRKRPR